MKEEKSSKTKEEILSQLYLSAYDLQILLPDLKYNSALKMIEHMIEIMKKEKKYVPPGQTKLALTSIVKRECGF